MRLGILAVLAAGCAVDDTPRPGDLGSFRACLETDASASAVQEGSYDRWEVSGVVTAVDSLEPRPEGGPYYCIPGRGRRFDLVDDAGDRWRVGWYATSGSVDFTPTTGLQPGDAVSVVLAHLNDFADDRALVVRGADGVVLAGEEGYGASLAGLEGDPAGDLVVERGEQDPRSFYETECGRQVPEELVFTADGVATTLTTWEEGTITLDGVTLEARNVGARTFLGQPTCTDVWGPAPWMVWR